MKAAILVALALLGLIVFTLNHVLNSLVGLFVWYFWPRVGVVALVWYLSLQWLVRGMVFPSSTYFFRRKMELQIQESMGRELNELLLSLKSSLITA
jgi:hypothetical protein